MIEELLLLLCLTLLENTSQKTEISVRQFLKINYINYIILISL